MKKFLFILLFYSFLTEGSNLEPHKKICSDIGFTAGTEDFAECVMDFFKKEKEKNQQSVNNKSNNSNSGSSNSNSLATQNQLLKEQFEYQKKRDEKEDFRRNMDNFGNLIDSLTGSGKYYQPSTTQYCRNYGTAQHPNVICQ